MSPPAVITSDEARTAILLAADTLFYQRGVTAVPMSDIRDYSGVSLRRLYSLFPHKSDLVAGWLEDRHTSWTAMFTRGIQRRLETGEEPIAAIFDSLGDWLIATNFRGCGFINTLAETGAVTEEHRTIIRRHKLALIELLARFTDQPAALAVLIDGAIVQAAVFASIDPVDSARLGAAPLLRSTTAFPSQSTKD